MMGKDHGHADSGQDVRQPFCIRLNRCERLRLEAEAGETPIGAYVRARLLGESGLPPRRRLRQTAPTTTVEILTPDFMKKNGAIETVVAARPDVFNHNLETVPRLYPSIRPGARYFTSLSLLQRVKEIDPSIFTKSGLMVGLGETREEVAQVMDDLRAADVDFLTIGQYLQPTPKHAAVDRFVTPDEFKDYATLARGKGFLLVSSSPLTRSSYYAGEDFKRLQTARAAQFARHA